MSIKIIDMNNEIKNLTETLNNLNTGKPLSDSFKKAQKKYYEKNKERLNKYRSEYYYKNCDKKYICICGSTMRNNSRFSHFKTNKHINYIENKKIKDENHQIQLNNNFKNAYDFIKKNIIKFDKIPYKIELNKNNFLDITINESILTFSISPFNKIKCQKIINIILEK
tara:strand:- start:42 stop:545 length:504 start_codon:yes stop_codon:yes gene_type:complete